VEFERIKEIRLIREAICFFEPIFPHLKEKISSYDEYAEKLSRYANVVVCKENHESVGLLVCYANDSKTKTAYVSLIGVQPQWQGKKIGKALLEFCIAFSLKEGMEFLKLEVDSDNARAMRFYSNFGFDFCGESGASSVYMCKRIK